MKDLIVRKASLSDAKSLETCMHLAYSKYIDRLNGKNIPPFHVDYEDEILNYPVFVVEKDESIIGGLVLSFDENYASISNISIHPEFQGMGLGKLLMDFSEKKAIEKNYLEIHLATHVLLTENIAFYKKLGYIEVSRDDKKVYMKKYLNHN